MTVYAPLHAVPYGGLILLAWGIGILVLVVGALLVVLRRQRIGMLVAAAGIVALGATAFVALVVTWLTPSIP